MANMQVTVVDGNNVTVSLDRGVAGVGIASISLVVINNANYLLITYTNGTTQTVGPVGVIQYSGTSPININGSVISLTTVPVNLGGTGLTAGTSGGVLAYTATGTLASSAALAASSLVIGGGAGAAPSTTTTGTGVLTFLGTPSSANLAAAVTDETGSGSLVFATSPTFATSVVGGATMAVFNTASTTVNAFGAATTLNIGAATGTLTVANTTLAAKALTATSITNSALTATRLVYSGTAGLEVDSANLTFNGTDLTVSGAVNAGSINATTLDLTNLEVTNIKAKDGTAAMQIADTTGVVSVTAAPVLTALTASSAVATDASKVLVSVTNTGTGDNVLATSPTLVTPALGAATATSLVSSGTAASSFTVTSGSAVPLTITNVGSGNSFVVEDSASTDSTPFVIDASGNVTVGAATPMTGFGVLQALGTGGFLSAIGQFSADTTAPIFSFNKSRSTTLGSPATIVASGDAIGQIRFNGADGTNFIRGATITAEVDGTPGTNDMPGRLIFSTTADGASSPSERMRIDNAGSVGIGQGAGGAGIALDITKSQTGSTSGYTVNARINPAVDVTTNATGYQTFAINGVGTSTTSFFHYTANQGTFSGTAPTNQYGFNSSSSLTGATNNYGFFSSIASGTNRYNFYAAGTATNLFSGNTIISVTDNTNAALRITQLGTGNALLVEDTTNPDSSPFVIDANGVAISGHTSAINTVAQTGNAVSPGIQQQAAAQGFATSGLYSWSSSAGISPNVIFSKSNSGTVGTRGVVANATLLGAAVFTGDDGTNFIRAATIEGWVDGTPGTNDMPGRLVFNTTADGASSPTERMRIDSLGNVGIGAAPGNNSNLNVLGTYTSSGSVTRVVRLNGTIPSASTNTARGYGTDLATEATAFTITQIQHFFANQGTIGAGSAATSQWGFFAESTLTGATNNYGFYSSIASGTNRFNFYANGTADNYFAGSVGIGAVPTAAAKSNIVSTSAGASTIALSLQNASNTVSSETVLDFVTNNNGAGVRSAQISAINTNGGTGVNMLFKIGNGAVASEAMRLDSLGNFIVSKAAVVVYQPGPAAISAAATLSNSNIQNQIISATGTTYTITMPLGTTLETLITWPAVNLGYDFTVINTATGVITMAVNTGVTSLGLLTIAAATSAQFRIRRTAVDTFILYRLA